MSRKWKIRILKFLLLYVVLVLGFYLIGGDEIRTRNYFSDLPAADAPLDEICEGTVIEQKFVSQADQINKITLFTATYGRMNRGRLVASLIDEEQQTKAAELIIEASLLPDNIFYEWGLDTPVNGAKGKTYALTIESECPAGEAPTIYSHHSVEAETELLINKQPVAQTLCFSYAGENITWFGLNYWKATFGLALVGTAYLIWAGFCDGRGRQTILGTMSGVWERYKFLIKQLVSRDFKTKYKRSVLGYLWSFLNPLLTMTVQYIVFSTIFRSDIKNFPVYLLSGIILFGFFTDAVNQGLNAIVGNSALITKVYVPKYIYPVTKVISSSINLMISIIPLLLAAFLTNAPISKALLLLPFCLLCLIVFSIGMALLLSASMVFFRDTQYLWGIISLAWMYATPLFYPENIIPEKYRLIQKLNPMYYIIKFARTILIEGVSPGIEQYVYCIGASSVMLLIGAMVFKKTQDKFVLYI